MCVNHKMSTTAAASNKQGDVELVNFGLNGSNNLVIDVSTTLVTAQLTTDTSTARCKPISRTICRNVFWSKSGGTMLVMLLLVQRLHQHLCQLLAKLIMIPSFFVSCGSWLTTRRAIIMRSSAWRRRLSSRLSARTFSFNKNFIGKGFAYATATRLHLSVNRTAPPLSSWPAHVLC